MQTVDGTGVRVRWSGMASAAALLSIAVLHAVWAFSSWPLPDRDAFARAVVGVPTEQLPGRGLVLLVAGLLLVAAALLAAGAGWLPRPGPGWVHRWGRWAVSGVLLVRGLQGLAMSAVEVLGLVDRGTPDAYLHLDLAVYSPLCLLLAAGAAAVARHPVGER